MKYARVLIVLGIILLTAVAAIPAGQAAPATEYGEVYPKLAIIVDMEPTEYDDYMFTCIDREGDAWTFYGEREDWDIGDIVNLLMWNIDEDIHAHEIIEIYFEGYAEDFSDFIESIGWQ